MRGEFVVAVLLSLQLAHGAMPRLVEADQASLPVARKIATPPVRTLVGYTRRVLQLHDGHTLAVFSYSNSAPANWLFLIDAHDLSSERIPIPNNDIASHAAALGSDGNIYIMPYHTPRAYKFDPAAQAFSPINVAGLPQGEYTWDALGGNDGCIYFGTYPSACLGRYEIATGKTKIWPHVVAKTTYVSDFAPDGDGVRCRAWGEDSVWLKLNATASEPRRIDPPPATAPATQRMTSAEPTFVEKVENAEITIGHYGSLTRRDFKSGAITRSRLDNLAPGGNAIMFIEAVTPTCVIGANYSQQHLFRLDPKTGDVEVSEDMIARMPGQPMCAVALDGKAYLGIYIHAILSVYDPAHPFKFDDNPRELGELFTKHHQTRPDGAATDGKLVFFSTQSDYGRAPSGALAVIDSATQKIDAYPDLIEGQNLGPLAYDAKSKLLWGGTNRWGQMSATPPTQPRALIYAFDPASRKVVTTLTPWKSADVVTVLGSPRDGLVIATSNGQVTFIDTAAKTASAPQPWPTPLPQTLRRGTDGHAYFVAAGRLYRWDVAANTLTPIASTPGCTMLTQPSPDAWLLVDATSVYRVRVQ